MPAGHVRTNRSSLAQRLLEGSDAVIYAGSVREDYLGVVADKIPVLCWLR